MFRVDTTTAVPALPAFGAPGTPGYFTPGNPGTGTPATVPGADWFNDKQEELIAVLTAAGIAPAKGTTTQLRDAIKTLIELGTGQYSLDTGAANAYVVALAPAVGVAPAASGLTVRFKAVNANTGASTLNAGWGAINLLREDGAALQKYDIVAGALVTATFDQPSNAFYVTSIMASQVAQPIAGLSRNLLGSAAGGTKTASWTEDEGTAETALGGHVYKGASLAFNFNGATVGANGMDTGATPVSGDLHVYRIYNPTTNTWACLGTTAGAGATIYGGVNMPPGYVASSLLWSGKTDGAGNIVAFVQRDREVEIASTSIATGLSATVWTSLSISSVVPANTIAVSGGGQGSGSNAGIFAVASTSGGIGQKEACHTITGGANIFENFNNLLIITAQTIWYQATAGGNSYNLTLSSYRF